MNIVLYFIHSQYVLQYIMFFVDQKVHLIKNVALFDQGPHI